jgi:hypothetical protein
MQEKKYQREYEYSIDFVHVVCPYVSPPLKAEATQLFVTRSTGSAFMLAKDKTKLAAEVHVLKEKEKGIRQLVNDLKHDAIKKYRSLHPQEPVPHLSNVHVTSVNKFKAIGPITEYEEGAISNMFNSI